VLIVALLIAVPIIIFFIIQYRKKNDNTNQINRQTQIEVQPLELKFKQISVIKEDASKKKQVNREISSISENLGSLIEKKNIIYKEKLNNSNMNESQGFIPSADE